MKTIGSKVPEALSNRIDNYADKHDLNTSQAIRQLIRAGLEAEENTTHTVTLPVLLLWAGSLFFTAAYVDATGAAGPVGTVAILAGIALMSDRLKQASASARRRLTGDATEDTHENTTE